ncbi:MAG: hypothetical protein LC723_00995 [Actinobacteria bacterium]|nr:hypothetical protein [Actinomycetota bacterium]
MKRIVLSLAVLLLSAPHSAGAVTIGAGVGAASTAITLVSLNVNNPFITSLDQTVNTLVASGSGEANTDPSSELRANFSFLAAHVPAASFSNGDTTTQTAEIKEGEISADSNTGSATDLATLPTNQDLPLSQAVTGSVRYSGVSATVRPQDPYAFSSLGNVAVDALAGTGLLHLDGVKIAVSDESSPSQASAIEGLEIADISVLKIGDLLQISNYNFTELVGLGASFDPGDTADLGTTGSTITGLLPGAITSTSPDDLANMAVTCPGDLVLSAIPGLCDALNGYVSQLEALRDVIAALPLIDLKDVRGGINANATDSTSKSIAKPVTWASAQVANVTVSANANDPQTSFTDLTNQVKTAVQQVTSTVSGLTGLRVTITVDDRSESPDNATDPADAAYHIASASTTGLRVQVNVPPPSSVASAGFTLAASSTQPMAFDARFLTLSGSARHRPAPNGSPNNPAGNTPFKSPHTGTNPIWALCGSLALILGFGLRRWLRDAA